MLEVHLYSRSQKNVSRIVHRLSRKRRSPFHHSAVFNVCRFAVPPFHLAMPFHCRLAFERFGVSRRRFIVLQFPRKTTVVMHAQQKIHDALLRLPKTTGTGALYEQRLAPRAITGALAAKGLAATRHGITSFIR